MSQIRKHQGGVHQIDGHERIVVVEEGDPLPRARLEACANFQHEFEPVEVQRICQLHAF